MKRHILTIIACSVLMGTPALAEFKKPTAGAYYCRDNPEECAAKGPGVIPYSAELNRLLIAVNDDINARIAPVYDEVEAWELYPSEGDCEDYALTKRRELINKGVSSAALSIAIVKEWPFNKPYNHVVLVVHTDDGNFVLDNLDPLVVRIEDTNHKYLGITTSAGLTSWSDMHGWISPQVTSDPTL